MNIFAISASQIPSYTANSIQVMKTCQALAQLGHQVTLLVPDSLSVVRCLSSAELSSHYGITTPFEIVYLSSRSRRRFTWDAVRQAKRAGADLLYVWPPQSAAFGLFANLPVILELHDLPTGLIGPLWFRLFLLARGRKRLLLITDALRCAVERELHLNLKETDVVIAPNGVDLERFDSLPDPSMVRQQIGLPETQTVICTGHLYTGRGGDLFLELAARERRTHFVWVGGRPEDVTSWRSRGDALQLDNVTFIGFVPNDRLPLYQAAADVLLMPYGRVIGISTGVGRSAEVSSPMKMFEYMAAGRAILASDLPVIREVLDDTTAAFAPPEDVDAWAAALKELLSNPQWRDILAHNARLAVEKYTWLERARRAVAGFEKR
jgi:glycosyltransferase involved in cell wall biosynthesis